MIPKNSSVSDCAPRPNEVDCKVHKMLAFQEWIWRNGHGGNPGNT